MKNKIILNLDPVRQYENTIIIADPVCIKSTTEKIEDLKETIDKYNKFFELPKDIVD